VCVHVRDNGEKLKGNVVIVELANDERRRSLCMLIERERERERERESSLQVFVFLCNYVARLRSHQPRPLRQH